MHIIKFLIFTYKKQQNTVKISFEIMSLPLGYKFTNLSVNGLQHQTMDKVVGESTALPSYSRLSTALPSYTRLSTALPSYHVSLKH